MGVLAGRCRRWELGEALAKAFPFALLGARFAMCTKTHGLLYFKIFVRQARVWPLSRLRNW